LHFELFKCVFVLESLNMSNFSFIFPSIFIKQKLSSEVYGKTAMSPEIHR
jgi:hypothetical protein